MRLQALVLTRGDLVAQRLACANRLAAPGGELVRRHLEPLLACIEAQIQAIEADITALIRTDPALAADAKTLRAIGGIGATTAAALLALMPELGRLTARQAAALAGLAPHPRQSGGRDAYRHTRGGRPEVKRALFMAALSAAKHNAAPARVLRTAPRQRQKAAGGAYRRHAQVGRHQQRPAAASGGRTDPVRE